MVGTIFGAGGGLEIAWDVQRGLDKGQAFPILGPLLVSPVKLLVSVAQTVSGLALFTLFATICIVTLGFTFSGSTLIAGGHTLMGLFATAYAGANMLSLGIVGWRIEGIPFV